MGMSRFRKSGGFLNGVDGRLTDYQFTDEFNGVAFEPGINPKTKKPRFHSLNAVISVRVDGADEDITTTLFAGGYDDFEVSEDGHILTPHQEGYQLGAGTPWATLVTSMESNGHPGTQSDDEDFIDYTPIIGRRYRFVQVDLDAKELAALKAAGKPTTRKGSDGKEYKLQKLMVDTVYDQEAVTPAVKAKGATKSAVKGTKVKATPEVDIVGLASAAILELVSKPTTKNKLGTVVLQKMLKDPNRDAIRTWLFNDDNLDSLVADEVIESFDRKTGTIVPKDAEAA